MLKQSESHEETRACSKMTLDWIIVLWIEWKGTISFLGHCELY